MRLTRVGAVVAVLALLATACSKKTGSGGDASSPTKIVVKAVESGDGKYGFEGVPASMKAGVVTFELQNPGKEEHEMQLIEVREGKTVDDVKKLFESLENSDGAPMPSWVGGAGGPAGVKAGETGSATVKLGPGTYAYVCIIEPEEEGAPSHYLAGMIGELKVEGTAKGSLPSATATITAKDYSFVTSGLKAGKNTVTFSNDGKELHHVIALPIADGKTFQDVLDFIKAEGETDGPPPVGIDQARSSSALDGGAEQVMDLRLEAGTYAFVCFLNDRAGGPPHVAKGMVAEVKIA